MQVVATPTPLATEVILYCISRHGRVGQVDVSVQCTTEGGTAYDGQTRHGVRQRVAEGGKIVVVEIRLVFFNQFLPLFIGGSNHPVGTVLFVRICPEHIPQIVLLYEDRVEINGLTIYQTTGNASSGDELLAVETGIVEEVCKTVKIGIFTQVFEYRGEVMGFSLNGKQDTIVIKTVG